MNKRLSLFVKNFSYSLSSNLISFIISILIVLIIPKLIGVKEYGYWQLYLFYSAYVGFMQFGWNDGIYLRYGGKNYNDLDKNLFFSQYWLLTFSQILLGGIFILIIINSITESERKFILIMVSFCMVIVGVRTMLIFIMQGTNRIKEYAKIIIFDRILYVFLIVIFLLIGNRDFKILILSDLIGKLFSLIYAVYICRDIVIRKISTFYFTFKETYENINAGIKLMFANISSLLLVGVVRFGIERTWDIATFGKVSLTLSVSKLLLLFINAVGIVIFPILKRTSEKNLASFYSIIRDFLMVCMLGLLIFYYPIKQILTIWLPQYSDSLIYMALLFPIIIFESKMALLINTYLKALRKEKLMLKINIVSLFLSLFLTFFVTSILKNLNLAVALITIIMAFRGILAEFLLSKIIKITLTKDILLESVLCLIFVVSGWFMNSWYSLLVYAGFYILYLLIKKEQILNSIKSLRVFMRN